VIVEIYPAENIKNPEIRKGLLKADLKVGEEITHIDGRVVKQILEQDIYPYIFASTAQWRDLMAYPKVLNGEYGTKAILRIRGVNGTVREVSLTRAAYRFPKKREFVFHELDGSTIYVNLPGFGSDAIVDDFDAVFDKISKAKGLILDMRENGGGNSAFGDRIISYLTDKPIEKTRWKTRQYMPAFRAWGEQEKWYQADRQIIEPRKEGSFAGPIVILTGPATFSAAEDFVVPLHASGRATVVGEKTGGSTGQPLIIELPGDGGARICTKRDAYPDGREFVGVGIIPDVEVHPTPADIAADHDVVLEEGIKVLKSKLM
jgi:C-terminal processing protease CtpA/Prc